MKIDNIQTVTVATAKLLACTAALALLLSVYQWVELVSIRTGGAAPLCTLGEHINCVTVWGSPLAQWVHTHTGMPLAAWGVAWSTILLGLAAGLLIRGRRGQDSPALAGAIKLTATAGAAAAVALLIYSIRIKVFCPTCVLSYVFVAIAAFLAYTRLPLQSTAWPKAALTSGLALAVTYATLIFPGLHTPRDDANTTALHTPAAAAPSGDALVDFLQSQPQQMQQIISNYLAIYRAAPEKAHKPDPHRIVWGTAEAPVHLIDWVDIRCPHCKKMDGDLARIRTMAPPGAWSEEARNFPLDAECNTNASRSDGTGVRCLAAKVLICLAGTPRAQPVREDLFAHQDDLSRERVWELAAPDANTRRELGSCVKSAATAAALRGDIDAAIKHNIEGTPLIVINGRSTPPIAPLIYALILAKGDSDARGFAVLPPPQTELFNR